MMRYLNIDQKKIYQHYSKLSEAVHNVSKLNQKTEYLDEYIWNLISNEGIWRLPIPKNYGGLGLGWQECIAALDGFISNYSDPRLFELFITQINAIYIILQYGTEVVKKLYLPRLIYGDMACLLISEDVHQLLHINSHSVKNKNKALFMKNNSVIINVEKIDNEIIFFLQDRKPRKIHETINKIVNPIESTKHKFIIKSAGILALYDLIQFEKLFYGIFTASYIQRVKKEN